MKLAEFGGGRACDVGRRPSVPCEPEVAVSESIRGSIGAAAGAAIGTLAYWLLLVTDYHVIAAVGAGVALGDPPVRIRAIATWSGDP